MVSFVLTSPGRGTLYNDRSLRNKVVAGKLDPEATKTHRVGKSPRTTQTCPAVGPKKKRGSVTQLIAPPTLRNFLDTIALPPEIPVVDVLTTKGGPFGVGGGGGVYEHDLDRVQLLRQLLSSEMSNGKIGFAQTFVPDPLQQTDGDASSFYILVDVCVCVGGGACR